MNGSFLPIKVIDHPVMAPLTDQSLNETAGFANYFNNNQANNNLTE